MKSYEELLAERDALAATIGQMIYFIERVYNSYKNNTGYEPSLSVFRRDLDEAYRFLDKTPQQCLAEIKAEAGRAGYELGAMQWCFDSSVMGADIESSAIRYAAKIRNTGTWLKDSNVNGGKRQGGEK